MVVPATFPDYTTRRVLTTGWLDGEKLSQSKADDVAQLVNLGVICYLKQLLDTGFFHVRPDGSSRAHALPQDVQPNSHCLYRNANSSDAQILDAHDCSLPGGQAHAHAAA